MKYGGIGRSPQRSEAVIQTGQQAEANFDDKAPSYDVM